jgi:hypothetical protein
MIQFRERAELRNVKDTRVWDILRTGNVKNGCVFEIVSKGQRRILCGQARLAFGQGSQRMVAASAMIW